MPLYQYAIQPGDLERGQVYYKNGLYYAIEGIFSHTCGRRISTIPEDDKVSCLTLDPRCQTSWRHNAHRVSYYNSRQHFLNNLAWPTAEDLVIPTPSAGKEFIDKAGNRYRVTGVPATIDSAVTIPLAIKLKRTHSTFSVSLGSFLDRFYIFSEDGVRYVSGENARSGMEKQECFYCGNASRDLTFTQVCSRDKQHCTDCRYRCFGKKCSTVILKTPQEFILGSNGASYFENKGETTMDRAQTISSFNIAALKKRVSDLEKQILETVKEKVIDYRNRALEAVPPEPPESIEDPDAFIESVRSSLLDHVSGEAPTIKPSPRHTDEVHYINLAARRLKELEEFKNNLESLEGESVDLSWDLVNRVFRDHNDSQ